MTWLGGGHYDFEFAGGTGDHINGIGSLDLSSLNSSSRFTINIQSFDASDFPVLSFDGAGALYLRLSDVAELPGIDAVAADIRAHLDGAVVVAHNAHIDLDVLTRELPGWQPVGVVDTLKLARVRLPGRPSYKLGALVDAKFLSQTRDGAFIKTDGGPRRTESRTAAA